MSFKLEYRQRHNSELSVVASYNFSQESNNTGSEQLPMSFIPLLDNLKSTLHRDALKYNKSEPEQSYRNTIIITRGTGGDFQQQLEQQKKIFQQQLEQQEQTFQQQLRKQKQKFWNLLQTLKFQIARNADSQSKLLLLPKLSDTVEMDSNDVLKIEEREFPDC